MRFVFFHFFNGTIVFFQIVYGAKSLNGLGTQVTIGHGMANHRNFFPCLFQNFRHPPSRLALSASGTHGTNANHGLRTGHSRSVYTHHFEICAGGIHHGTQMHHVYVLDIGIGKNHLVHTKLPNQGNQFTFIVYRYAVRIQRTSQF